jgi:hypothetical protein
MNNMLSALIERLNDKTFLGTNIIPWSSPITSFGDLSRSRIATLGLNPSNREFVDGSGNELVGQFRRFHTLKSLDLTRWSDANVQHLRLIANSCRAYFSKNPYDGWFKKLDHIISGTRASYYDDSTKACHLDLIPYATARKWTELTSHQRSLLLALAGDTLALLLRDSPVRILVLNGKTVVENFQSISGIELQRRVMHNWTLPRQSGCGVEGFAYRGVVRNISGIKLNHKILVLGFNHNIQSSFGVTTQVMAAIRRWVTRSASEAI